MARSLLESSGIAVYLCDENLVRLEWQISNFIGGIRLQVAAEDESEALQTLQQAIPGMIDFGVETAFIQPNCPQCGSINIKFEGASRKAALALLFAFSLPLFTGFKTWTCHNCGHRWRDQVNDD